MTPKVGIVLRLVIVTGLCLLMILLARLRW
jgi:hypothetical protein